MKAAVSARYGPPGVVHVEDVPTPSPGSEEVLVRVLLATVNRTDCGYRAAHPFFMRAVTGLRRPKRLILGTEFAGVVDAMGTGVKQFRVGDRVFGYSEPGLGAHAEYLAIAQDGPIATIPEGVSDELAAASTEASHYALAIIRKARIGPGQDVLVYGASGGIGSAAVQLLKALGVNVTAVCGPESVALVRQLGADRVIDRSIEDFTQDAHEYDFVLDAVGKSSFGQCRSLLRPGGAYLTTDLGAGWQNPFLALTTKLTRGRKVMLPPPSTFDKALIEEFQELLRSGQFRPVIDNRRYRLDQIVEAYEYVESQQKIGNVLLSVAPAGPLL